MKPLILLAGMLLLFVTTSIAQTTTPANKKKTPPPPAKPAAPAKAINLASTVNNTGNKVNGAVNTANNAVNNANTAVNNGAAKVNNAYNSANNTVNKGVSAVNRLNAYANSGTDTTNNAANNAAVAPPLPAGPPPPPGESLKKLGSDLKNIFNKPKTTTVIKVPGATLGKLKEIAASVKATPGVVGSSINIVCTDTDQTITLNHKGSTADLLNALEKKTSLVTGTNSEASDGLITVKLQ